MPDQSLGNCVTMVVLVYLFAFYPKQVVFSSLFCNVCIWNVGVTDESE